MKIRENGEVYCNQTEWFTHKIGLMLKTGKGVKDGRCRKFRTPFIQSVKTTGLLLFCLDRMAATLEGTRGDMRGM